ncbi:hypothetical protein CANARDRAFT_202607 [[Candida] arabinofermentans NRRL YB-2248]|uniref:Large ribosomal subunit protein uL3m n=1 Tax=[Candida] arabinofermentans NRRL YB-2248 TaxID=983967 RepID=A0A1E4SW96_9ASCO|nr:hypothetical protein CANARDRAFT_202607 [[Candida] arabinofermentans NRRL YB-2248]
MSLQPLKNSFTNFIRFSSTSSTTSIPLKQLISPSSIPYLESKPKLIQKSPEARRIRKKLLERPGLIGVKRGMTCYYNNQGKRLPATVIEIDQVEVIYNKTVKKNGYFAIQLGYGHKSKNQTKSMLGHFANAQISPKEKIWEFQVKNEQNLLPLGTQLKADHFKIGQLVDITSKSKGKGFSGVMKRWNFHGLKATHGVSLAHRSAGSTGQNTSPGRVFPGKKMAGHLGDEFNTIINLPVLDVNAEKGYILVKGCVSGSNGSYVRVRDALSVYGSHISVTG